jgi:23S rRNA (guanine745-N1)-methyltransferase
MKLICPNCGKPLTGKEKTAVCENGHSFDYAKQGYLNLLIRQSVDHGDNKAMVKARTDFLNTGAYGFLREKLQAITETYHPEVLADLGCGEGYYTAKLQASEKYGFDMSKEALKHASRTDRTTQYAVASIFHLPLPDESCDMMTTCFAPFAKDEIERCLKEKGIFVFVSPGPKHLFEMKQILYETPYENEVKELQTSMSKVSEEIISSSFHTDHAGLMALFDMTPYSHRTKESDMEKLNAVQEIDLTAQFVVRIYQKN